MSESRKKEGKEGTKLEKYVVNALIIVQFCLIKVMRSAKIFQIKYFSLLVLMSG